MDHDLGMIDAGNKGGVPAGALDVGAWAESDFENPFGWLEIEQGKNPLAALAILEGQSVADKVAHESGGFAELIVYAHHLK